jgi:hypothetical protein
MLALLKGDNMEEERQVDRYVLSLFSIWYFRGVELFQETARLSEKQAHSQQLALCEAWGRALDVTGRRSVAMAGRLVVEVGWRRCCLETAGSVLAPHWGSLGQTCCSAKPKSLSGWFPLKLKLKSVLMIIEYFLYGNYLEAMASVL